jgi:hypothetical protein
MSLENTDDFEIHTYTYIYKTVIYIFTVTKQYNVLKYEI